MLDGEIGARSVHSVLTGDWQFSVSPTSYRTTSLIKTATAFSIKDTKRCMWMQFLVQCSFLSKEQTKRHVFLFKSVLLTNFSQIKKKLLCHVPCEEQQKLYSLFCTVTCHVNPANVQECYLYLFHTSQGSSLPVSTYLLESSV